MRCASFLLLVLLSLSPSFTNAQPSSAEQPSTSSYLKDLEDLGYCVIPELLSASETKLLYERVWHEFIEKAWPQCRMDDRSNWKETFPIHDPHGVFAGPAGQTQVMWDLRQDPRIVGVFAQVWNTDGLIVSMDGLSIMCPQEIRDGKLEPWPHVDQMTYMKPDNTLHTNNPPIDFVSESSLRTKPFTIQGQFLLEDSAEGDGGFYCIPKSHLKFNEFAPQLEAIQALDVSREERRKARDDVLETIFGHSIDESGNPYCWKHITAPRGSLILWDSRTLHWNQHASKDRPHLDTPKVRMVGYLCYVPKARLGADGRALRKRAFDTGVSTGHNPSYPHLKSTKDHIKPEYEQYLEDPSYIQPKLNLTELGTTLLGI